MDISHGALYNAIYSDLTPYLRGSGLEQALPPDASPRSFAAHAALKASLSKLLLDGEVTQSQKTKAHEKFVGVNRTCGSWEYAPLDMHEEYLFGEFRSEIYHALSGDWGNSIFSWDSIVKNGAPGPGASAGVDRKDAYSKMWDTSLTTSSEYLYMMYRGCINTNPSWKFANEWREKVHGEFSVVEASSQFFVAKNVDTARMAATEPSLNMYLQKGIGNLIEAVLQRRYGIDLASQPECNRALARMGSISGEYATIDLSSASDSISMNLLKRVLSREQLGYLQATRSSKMRCEDGSFIELNMVSTMGNGFTFPLETLLFTCMVIAAYRLAGVPLRLNRHRGEQLSIGNFGVFGDDIIVHKDAVGGVLKLLRLCGFTTNGDKTFVEGPFRESCGGDFYQGSPVRSFYIKKLSTLEDTYVAINAAVEWSAKTGIPLYGLTRLLRDLVKAKLPTKVGTHWVPGDYPEDSGIRTPYSLLRDRTESRRDGSLVIRYMEVIPEKVKLLYYAIDLYGDLRVEVSRLVGPKARELTWRINPLGLHVSALGGYVRERGWSLSNQNPKYRNRATVDPGWGRPVGLASDQVPQWATMADRLLA